MKITPVGTSNLALTWTVPSTNFVLQSSTNLAVWVNVTNAFGLNITNYQNLFSFPRTSTGSFFRLATP